MVARRQLVAVDTNILLDLANQEDEVLDAIVTIRRRLKPVTIAATPTVLHELANLMDHGETAEIRQAARAAAHKFHRVWRFELGEMSAVQNGIAERVGASLRERGLLPEIEVHDGLILAEAGLLSCAILLTSDEHLRGIDYRLAALTLKSFDVEMPVIATPREIVRRFF